MEFSDKQFADLLQEIRNMKSGPPGAMTSHEKTRGGLGSICSGDGGMGLLAGGVYDMLALGSPRLAYAMALGVRLVPYYFNIRALFDNVDTTDVPDQGADVKIVTDTLVDAVLIRIINQSTTANQNGFQAQTDWYYTFQSGIEATLEVQGAPRPTLAPKFTPLASLADAFNGSSHYPRGFILSYQQQLQASFHATVTLPYAPIEVILTFRSFTTDNDAFTQMTNKQAFEGLVNCGFQCSDAYIDRVLSVCR